MRNYNSSAVGVPYIRVPTIQISYPQPLQGNIRFQEVEAVILADGSTRQLNELGEKSFSITPAQMQETIQLIDPTTGADIPGQTMTVMQLMLGILAVIRREQVAQS